MKKLIALLAVVVIGFTAQSQTLVYLGQGDTTTTQFASSLKYTSVVSLNYSATQGVSATVAVDSLSGAPAGKFIMQHSTDGIHWNTYIGDTISYTNTGWTIHGTCGCGDTKSFQTFQLTKYPFYGAYLRFKITTTSATQYSRYWIKVKSSNFSQ